ncbi:hypothetical protein BQ8482_350075 [Mesorhizobium delmotii]|uniref:Uncharacterized protein n=1 Tax=Mesorhizobium delmotii TaxID=1631247 RepID=A0A2P9AQJ2_9HYPH|nr:hypothetical protein BQ8482_350075 [Mesorhizobium delmotii]
MASVRAAIARRAQSSPSFHEPDFIQNAISGAPRSGYAGSLTNCFHTVCQGTTSSEGVLIHDKNFMSSPIRAAVLAPHETYMLHCNMLPLAPY